MFATTIRLLQLLYIFWFDLLYCWYWGSPHPNRATIVRSKIQQSGILFIKFAQWASQYQSIPATYREEFKHLLTNCSYHNLNDTLAQIPPTVLKQITINPNPIASGSIGQVYLCRYEDRDCVIKVKHPIDSNMINRDIYIVSCVTSILDIRVFDFKTFIASITQQQDFVKEVRNLRTIRENFKDFEEYVVVPEVLEYNNSFIIETYVDGVTLDQLDESELDAFSVKLALIYIKMMYVDYFIHGDLHPGNIIVTKTKKVGLIDFGLCEKITPLDIEILGNFVQSFVDQDFDRVLRTFKDMGCDEQSLRDPILIQKIKALIHLDITCKSKKQSPFDKLPPLIDTFNACNTQIESRILYLLMNYSIIVPNGEQYFSKAIKKIVSDWELTKHYGYSIQPLIDYYEVYD